MYGIASNHAVCNNCGLFFASRHLDSDSLSRVYESYYSLLDPARQNGCNRLFEQEKIKGIRIKKLLSNSGFDYGEGSMVVDIGCGSGGALKAFSEGGAQVFGIDLDKRYVDFAVSKGLNAVFCDAKDLSKHLEQRSIDLIILDSTLEHMSDPKKLLNSVSGFLKTTGKIFINVPGFRNIGLQYKYDLKRYLQFLHLIHFDAVSLAALLENCGLKVEFIDESVQAIASCDTKLRKDTRLKFQSETNAVDFLEQSEYQRQRLLQRISNFFFFRCIWQLGVIRKNLSLRWNKYFNNMSSSDFEV
jgi:SAM-dependent methyltransferase